MTIVALDDEMVRLLARLLDALFACSDRYACMFARLLDALLACSDHYACMFPRLPTSGGKQTTALDVYKIINWL